MGLSEDLLREVGDVIREPWKNQIGDAAVHAPRLPAGNHAMEIEGTVLCADISGSTELVEQHKPAFAATVYKAFLQGATLVVRSEGGEVAGSDGDRLTAIFSGDQRETAAARAAFKLHYAVKKVINTLLRAQFPAVRYDLHYAAGIESGKLTATRSGVTGMRDVLWMGAAINYAAKMARLPSDFPTRVSDTVFLRLDDSVKLSNGKNMWEPVSWKETGRTFCRSAWLWPL